MGVKRSNIECKNWKIYANFFVGFVLIWAAGFSCAVTNPNDGKLYFYLTTFLYSVICVLTDKLCVPVCLMFTLSLESHLLHWFA